MELLYRFCWMADEISDGPGTIVEKCRKLARFKQNLRDTFRGKPKDYFFCQFQTIVQRFGLTREPLERIVNGVQRDLRPVRFKKFTELHHYALQVAGGPGLSSMEIFGFKDKPHREYAENLGVFLQIVNVARDFLEDKAIKRIYFPSEDFKRFHLNPQNIDENNSHWKLFVEFQLDRAWGFLEKARQSLSRSQRAELSTAEAIAAVYVKLFQKLKNNPYRILQGRITLSKWDKLISVIGIIGQCHFWKWADKKLVSDFKKNIKSHD